MHWNRPPQSPVWQWPTPALLKTQPVRPQNRVFRLFGVVMVTLCPAGSTQPVAASGVLGLGAAATQIVCDIWLTNVTRRRLAGGGGAPAAGGPRGGGSEAAGAAEAAPLAADRPGCRAPVPGAALAASTRSSRRRSGRCGAAVRGRRRRRAAAPPVAAVAPP